MVAEVSLYQIALRLMPLVLTGDTSTLVQVMAWCHQATSHYLNQYWPRSLSPYDVIRPQWVKQFQDQPGIWWDNAQNHEADHCIKWLYTTNFCTLHGCSKEDRTEIRKETRKEFLVAWCTCHEAAYYGSMNYYPLFRVRSWNSGMRCMSFYILMESHS